jgi:hypothetical protein
MTPPQIKALRHALGERYTLGSASTRVAAAVAALDGKRKR